VPTLDGVSLTRQIRTQTAFYRVITASATGSQTDIHLVVILTFTLLFQSEIEKGEYCDYGDEANLQLMSTTVAEISAMRGEYCCTDAAIYYRKHEPGNPTIPEYQ
jgi:hypothetical protein